MCNWSRIACTLIFAIILAGCGESDRKPFQAGPLGAVEVDVNEPIHVRSLLAHAAVPAIAEWIRYGIEMAIADFGYVHGHAVQLGRPIDTMCSPEGGEAGAQEVTSDPQVVGVIGPLCSGAAVAASPLLSDAGLIMISPTNGAPTLTSDLAGNASPDYNAGYFRTNNNDLYQARAVAEFAYHHLNLRRVATVDDGDPYTAGLAVAFADAFGMLGGAVPVASTINKGDTDMNAVLVELAAVAPDGVFFPLFLDEGSLFAEQARDFPGLEDAILITDKALLESAFLVEAHSEDIYLAGARALDGSAVNASTGKSGGEVLAALETRYGTPETPYWAHAYDATALLLSAIDAVAVNRGGKLYVDRALLRQELAATNEFQGLLGELSCDDFGDCGTGYVDIFHHTDSTVADPARLPVVYSFEP